VSAWLPGPARPSVEAFEADEVQLWLVDLEGPAPYRDVLADDERERAARFHFERDRRRFIAARTALREVLGRYLQRDPAALAFAYAERGKPSLTGDGDGALEFNLSHAQERALLAVRRAGPLGVDVEYVPRTLEWEGIAARCFCPGEIRSIGDRPAPARPGRFFELWTRKEAVIKATGEGLGAPLTEIDTTIAPPGWFLESLVPDDDYVAAVAGEGRLGPLRTWRFTDDDD
jgi:4'-phosphopantetheinyl transferase